MKTDYLAKELLAVKRDGGVLDADAIGWMIDAFHRGEVTDDQMAALAMAVCIRGMNDQETTALTLAMHASGQTLGRIDDRPRIDKHSTGGLGDKVSLILAPLLAAAGGCVPMISGRGLGHTGGTLDKLESIPGFDVQLTPQRRDAALRRAGCFIVGADQSIAPADRRLYAIRDVTATVPSIPLITASILSKKLAAGLDALIMDVKVGSGAFMTTLPDATALAESLIRVGGLAGLPTTVLISDMNQPLGYAVGNANEVNEAVDVLRGGGPGDVIELTLQLGSQLCVAASLAADEPSARRTLATLLSGGAAYESFERLLAAQSASWSGPLPLATTHRIVAGSDGWVSRIDCPGLGSWIQRLGGGRRRTGDAIDHQVGITLQKKVGDRVVRGEPLALLHCHDPLALDYVGPIGALFEIRESAGDIDSMPLVHRRLP